MVLLKNCAERREIPTIFWQKNIRDSIDKIDNLECLHRQGALNFRGR